MGLPGSPQGWDLHPTIPEMPRRQAGHGLPWFTHQTPHKRRYPFPENRVGGCPEPARLPSSGFHTRCKQQRWSWARQSCGSVPVGQVEPGVTPKLCKGCPLTQAVLASASGLPG